MRPSDSHQVVPSCLQVDDNKLVATRYEQPVLVLLEQRVAHLLPSYFVTRL